MHHGTRQHISAFGQRFRIPIPKQFGYRSARRAVENTVVVSGAAGSMGSIAGQIAWINGCRAIGITGGEDECRRLVEELGFDAIDYEAGDLRAQLKTHAPNGIDAFFDHVGAEALEAALSRLGRGARVLVFHCADRYAEGVVQLANWLRSGELRAHQRVSHGDVGDFPKALLALFRGQNTGKLGSLARRPPLASRQRNCPTSL